MQDDESLWRIARERLAGELAERLETLHFKRQRGLTESEDEQRAMLIEQVEQIMVARPQAAALLAQRGHDVSELVAR